MAAKRNTSSYMRAFSSNDLWETVDTIMIDLLAQPSNDAGVSTSVPDNDADLEKNVKTLKKNEELEKMMGNLDTILDDLPDISTLSNGEEPTNTPPNNNNSSSGEIMKPKNGEFLEKENPFDSITQGFLYQAGDVPLFSSSADVGGTAEVVDSPMSYDEYDESEGGNEWDSTADEEDLHDDGEDDEVHGEEISEEAHSEDDAARDHAIHADKEEEEKEEKREDEEHKDTIEQHQDDNRDESTQGIFFLFL
jgi:hypothetical protein